ncbi:hypothetical protein K7432_014534 [Basidiobolus ranarum]|uniref:SMP-LTD domain-containing protein n=1 Tax=Basidiobolus ranarum TaxID=34480 RepID=A0ABR2VPD8_9FUNG
MIVTSNPIPNLEKNLNQEIPSNTLDNSFENVSELSPEPNNPLLYNSKERSLQEEFSLESKSPTNTHTDPTIRSPHIAPKLNNPTFTGDSDRILNGDGLKADGLLGDKVPVRAAVETNQGFKNDKSATFRPLPLKTPTPKQITASLEQNGTRVILGCGITCYICGCLFGTKILFIVVVIMFSCSWGYQQCIRQSRQGVEWMLERDRANDKLIQKRGESVEWINHVLGILWRSLEPSLFSALIDMMEDAMAEQLKTFARRVKIVEFDVGIQAPRLSNVRIFPSNAEGSEDMVYGEATFSFHAFPMDTHILGVPENRATPPHFTLELHTGINATIPVRAELLRCDGRVKFDIRTMSNAPFLQEGIFAFVSMPVIECAVRPLIQHFNLMKVPIFKGYIEDAIKATLAEMTQPKSLTLDLESFLTGDDVIHDTRSIGVIKVDIYEGANLADLDLGGD